MSNVSQWNTTAASNNTASPDGWPEGMSPSGVNDSARENMAALAKVYQDQDGSLVTAGTGTAYTLSTNNSHAALADIGLTVFRIHTANTGSATLAVDSLTAKTMKIAGANLVSGDLPQDSLVVAAYNATGDVFDVFAFPAGGVTKTGTQTLTNKTLTSPDINTPDIDGGTIDNAVIGGATAAAATVTTLTASTVVCTGNVDGRDVSADGTKLDGIEAAADVTDEANVKSALNGATLTAVTGADADKVLIQDASDSDNLKTVTLASVSGRELLQTVTISSDATVDLGEGGEIDSTYKKYEIELINVIPATDSTDLELFTSADTGSTYDSTAADYSWARYYGTTSTQITTNGSTRGVPMATGVGSAANENGVNGTIEIYDPSAANYTGIKWSAFYDDDAGEQDLTWGGGRRKAAEAVDAVRLKFLSGNLESGTVKLYGIK